MNFDLNESINILSRTPHLLKVLLEELPDHWLKSNEGHDTWSPYDIVGHLIYGEKTDWMPRLQIILEQSDHPIFEPFDRFAQLKEDQNQSISQRIDEFNQLRKQNLNLLRSLQLNEEHFSLKGIHPEFGEVTLEQLLATWVVHDLGHIAQITRVMSKQYTINVGPWKAYLGVLNR